MQGQAWPNTTHDPYIIKSADKVVITGGGFTAWTSLVASYALANNKTLIMTELALGAKPDNKTHPLPNHFSALSSASAQLMAQYHNIPLSKITVTGTPLLDDIRPSEVVPNTALILSSVSRPEHDPENLVLQSYNFLQSMGYKVKVRPHPREIISDIHFLELDRSPTLLKEASSASLILAYPGTPLPILAALKKPVILITPNEYFEQSLPAYITKDFTTRLSNIKQLPDLINTVKPLTYEKTQLLTGPLGLAANRVINFWENATDL